MKLSYIFTVIVLVLVSSGCTSRQYYEPADTQSTTLKDKSLDYSISVEIEGVYQDDDGKIVDKKYNHTYKARYATALFKLINTTKTHIMTADRSGKINIIDRTSFEYKTYNTKTAVLSASIEDNIMAILHYDNSISIFDISTQKILFKSYQSKSYTIDDKIANPYFMDDIILFPTINGNVVVVSKEQKSLIRTITIDTKDRFSNIKFLSVIDEKLIMASPHAIMSLSSNQSKNKKYDIRQIFIKDKFIYISTLDGQILKLDNSLTIINKSKLKFGRINAIGFGGKYFYAYESEGYLVQFDDNLSIKNIFEYSKSDDKIFIFDDTLYIGDEAIELK